jgi:hypothetical protein
VREQASDLAVSQNQLAFLSLHVALSILLCTPLLIWAGAITQTPFPRVIALSAAVILCLNYAQDW